METTAVERLLREAAPHELLVVLRAVLTAGFAARTVELLLADYGMTELQPVTDSPYTGESRPVLGTVAGAAFAGQRLLVEPDGGTVTAHVPVSVRGDRLGVLAVSMATVPDAGARLELSRIAEALAHELLVAGRDTDLYLQARRTSRLTLAAEMQWQLLPGRSCARPGFALGGQLEPAYAVRGDSFDWSATATSLTVTLVNGMGDGVDAAMVTHLAVNALRNARRAGVPLTAQAELADQALHAHYDGREHVTGLLLTLDLATGAIDVLDAGAPRLWLLRDGEARRISLAEQLPLGAFGDTEYGTERLQARPGDRLVFVSDGVHDTLGPSGDLYGEGDLGRAVVDSAVLPAAQVPNAVLADLAARREAAWTVDDAMVVCLDWFGPEPDRDSPARLRTEAGS
ncbi:PP2C family protein-serine/threonine phosphatase [Amycolatopsis rifamycinica]|uniref:Phosphatase n=1 Tax=Amycolatopsis rifamycinica TaxID=287986 RepID=A0A066UEW0_9PSEU|nr:PP2C family protein-serine/threonine phosphatase [Amycolatopsis rifamycinica]KDN22659.1 phosphatase [Amycolatopsis rifamycinica]